MSILKRYAADGLHEKILECMKELPKGFVLDAPCGQGALSEDLERVGFKVVSGDIEKENILYSRGKCVQLDLTEPFPFKAGTFDYGVCVEGIEHLENPHWLIKEFARVIKKDGYLIITTPNVMTIKSRLRFLFYSYLDFFKHYGPLPLAARHRVQEHEHQHLNPLFYGEMKFIFEKYGFRIWRIETNKKVRKWKVIYPTLKWLVRKKTKGKFQADPFLVSDTLLEGEILIYMTKH